MAPEGICAPIDVQVGVEDVASTDFQTPPPAEAMYRVQAVAVQVGSIAMAVVRPATWASVPVYVTSPGTVPRVGPAIDQAPLAAGACCPTGVGVPGLATLPLREALTNADRAPSLCAGAMVVRGIARASYCSWAGPLSSSPEPSPPCCSSFSRAKAIAPLCTFNRGCSLTNSCSDSLLCSPRTCSRMASPFVAARAPTPTRTATPAAVAARARPVGR